MMRRVIFVVLSSFVFSSAQAAGPAEQIDDLFAKAAESEKTGDYGAATDAYHQIEALAGQLGPGQKAQVLSQAHARLARTRVLSDACVMSERDHELFETAKNTKGEARRVAEICKQILQGKDARCRAFAEIREFCPPVAGEGDPCKNGSPEAQAELSSLQGKLGALRQRMQNPQNLEALIAVSKDAERLNERLVALREIYLNCDAVHAGLVEKTEAVKDLKQSALQAAAAGYRARVGKLLGELETLKKNNLDAERQLDALNAFTNTVLIDVMSLAEGEALTREVKIEGQSSSQPSDVGNAELAKVLAGDRQAISQMIKENPQFFATASGREGLKKKKENLERIDTLLQKFGEQGYNHGLGFQKAQAEVKGTLQVVNAVLGREGEGAETGASSGGRSKVVVIAVVGGFLLVIAIIVARLSRRRPGMKN